MVSKVLLTAVSQPNPKHLGDLLFLYLGETLIEPESPFPLQTTGAVLVGVPIGPCQPDASVGLLNQGTTEEFLIRNFLFLTHRKRAKTLFVVLPGL